MTYEANHTIPETVLELIAAQGLGAVAELIRLLLNQAMLIEREQHVGAAAYERSPTRTGHANGFKEKTVQTRVGEITFAVPQVREGGFYPQALEKGMRSERALRLSLAEMYVSGTSTRKVKQITEQLCGTEVSSSQVSRATALLDPVLETWRQRPLGQTPYLVLDARYEKVRQAGMVQDAAVLIAMGVETSGQRRILGVSVALGEHEVHWRTFLQQLVARGLSGVELITADAHEGLAAARRAVFGGVPYQRCQFHLQQNAQAYVPRHELKPTVAAEIRAIFNAPTRPEAERLLAQTVKQYEKAAPRLATWMEEALPEGLTVFAFPAAHQRRLRTTNGLERLNQEIRRRTRVVRIFPNVASCLRLVSALLMEIDEEWLAGRSYLSFAE
jgi:transposase-like protein